MATIPHWFTPEEAQFLAAAFPQYLRTLGTNFPDSVLMFDGGSADEEAYFKFQAHGYGSGNLTLDVYWRAATATSGNIVWGAQIAAITSNTDSQDVTTKAFAAAQTAQDAHLGTVAQRLHQIAITISNLDSLAADDIVWLKVYRDASDTTNDTLAGDAGIVLLRLTYSDT